MTALLLIALGVCGVPLSMYANSWFNNRRWAGVWRGHRILLQQHKGRTRVFVDQELVADFTYVPFVNRLNQEWQHAELGATELLVRRLHDEYLFTLQIGSEVVPLVDMSTMDPDEQADPWASLLPGQQGNLTDPRWIAACQLLQLIRQSPAASEEVLESATLIQSALRKHFEVLRRLGDDSSVLEPVAGIQTVKAQIEEKLAAGIKAIQELHLVTVSLESHQDDCGALSKVSATIELMQLDSEAEKIWSDSEPSLSPSKQTLKKKSQASVSSSQ